MRVRAVIAVTAGILLAPASGADANHALIEPAHSGTAGSEAPGGSGTTSSAVSPEGRVFFTTRDSLVPQDTDGLSDLYERSTGAPTLVSTGPSAGGGQIVDLTQTQLLFPRAGGRVFFTTPERLTPDDTDAAWDYYEWFNGVNRLVPISPGCSSTGSVELNADGSRVFYQSTAQLVPEDTDTGCDIYLYAGGQTTLVTTGPGGGFLSNGVDEAVSDDGSRVLFGSAVAEVPEDHDSLSDVYLWEEGAITLVSTGPGDTHTYSVDSRDAAMSRDGRRVIFDTQEPLLPEDTDTQLDVYEREGATLMLRSPGGTPDAWARLPVQGHRAVSDDGSRVVFQSGGPGFTPDDTDNREDLYENVGGVTRLVSTAPTVACPTVPARCGVEFHRMNSDGTHIVWTTEEQLAAGDTDHCNDAYERTNGETRLVTVGGAVCRYYRVAGISDDGERIFFEHDASLVAEDLDNVSCTTEGTDGETLRAPCLDVYERHAGRTTLLSIGPIGGRGGANAHFRGASDDGKVVAFRTAEPLFMSDTNNVPDLFIRRVATGYPQPKAASPLRVSLVPAMQACSSPNRTHGPPLEHPACSPPVASSTLLTAGFGDGHPAPARSVGYARLAAIVGPPDAPDDSDIRLQTRITNVMLASDLSDYTGELRGEVALRITDGDNGGEQGTVADVPFRYTVPCAPTASTTVGAECDLQTTADALVPGMVAEGMRAIFALGQVRVSDGGPDHDGDTEGDNSPFAVQGIFVP